MEGFALRVVNYKFLPRSFTAAAVILLTTSLTTSVWAIGTDAGVNIQNTATATYAIGGTAQPPVSSNTVQTLVDELLDVAVVNDDGGPVAVNTPESGAILQFTVTNNGNGTETFRIVADPNIVEGGFDPTVNQLYLETNGIPGLQIGSDTAYVTGSGDPTLAEDEALTVYVESDIPGALAAGDDGEVTLRAVAQTIFTQAGTDSPEDVNWPTPGTSYPGQGDGGGNAVVGTSHDIGALLARTTGIYEVSNAVVTITKTAINVTDPFGGTTLVPGTTLTYQLEVSVAGSGTVDNLVIADIVPAELAYEANTLAIDGVAEDDDFAPAGTDNSGFDTPNTTVQVDRGTVAAGGPTITITFDATIR